MRLWGVHKAYGKLRICSIRCFWQNIRNLSSQTLVRCQIYYIFDNLKSKMSWTVDEVLCTFFLHDLLLKHCARILGMCVDKHEPTKLYLSLAKLIWWRCQGRVENFQWFRSIYYGSSNILWQVLQLRTVWSIYFSKTLLEVLRTQCLMLIISECSFVNTLKLFAKVLTERRFG